MALVLYFWSKRKNFTSDSQSWPFFTVFSNVNILHHNFEIMLGNRPLLIAVEVTFFLSDFLAGSSTLWKVMLSSICQSTFFMKIGWSSPQARSCQEGSNYWNSFLSWQQKRSLSFTVPRGKSFAFCSFFIIWIFTNFDKYLLNRFFSISFLCSCRSK